MKSFSLVFLATIIARLSSLISFPITARVLQVSDMGDLTIWHSVRGIVLLAALAGMPDIVAREAGAHKSQRSFVSALKVSYLMLGLIGGALEIVQTVSPGLIGIPHLHLLLAAACVDVVPGLFMTSLAAMGRITGYVACIVVPALLVASLSALLVLPPFSLGLVGPLYAHLIASSINAAMCFFLWWRYKESANAQGPTFAGLLRQSVPVLGVSLVGMSFVTVDRYAIRFFAGAGAVGLYAVSYQVAALLSFGGAAVRTSILSRLIAHAGERSIIARYFRNYFVCGGMFAVALVAMAPEIVALLAGPKYQSTVRLVPLLCAAILALEVYSFGQSLAVAQGRSGRAFKGIAMGAVLALLLVPSLCYLIGPLGVAAGLLAGYLLAAGFVLARQVSVDRGAVTSLVAVTLLLIAMALMYSDPLSSTQVWARAGRYLLALFGTAVGLDRLRVMGKGQAE